MLQLVLKYLVTVAVPMAIQIFGSKHLGTEESAALGGAVALVGSRLLHTTNPPAKKE